MPTLSEVFVNTAKNLGGNLSFKWKSSDFKIGLLTSGIRLNTKTFYKWADVSYAEISSTGYLPGGILLKNKDIKFSSGTTFFTADTVETPNINTAVKYAVLYKVATGDLVAYIDLDVYGVGLLYFMSPFILSWPDGFIFSLRSKQYTTIEEVTYWHNRLVREPKGLSFFTENAKLSEAAQVHADWMAANKTMTHAGAGGSTFSSRIQATGYHAQFPGSGYPAIVGENIAQVPIEMATPQFLTQAWINSPGHYGNMLNTAFFEMGYGQALSDDDYLYACVNFGGCVLRPHESSAFIINNYRFGHRDILVTDNLVDPHKILMQVASDQADMLYMYEEVLPDVVVEANNLGYPGINISGISYISTNSEAHEATVLSILWNTAGYTRERLEDTTQYDFGVSVKRDVDRDRSYWYFVFGSPV